MSSKKDASNFSPLLQDSPTLAATSNEFLKIDPVVGVEIQSTSPDTQPDLTSPSPIQSQLTIVNIDETSPSTHDSPRVNTHDDLACTPPRSNEERVWFDSNLPLLDRNDDIYKWTELSPEQKRYREATWQYVEPRFKKAGVDIEENFQDYAQFEADNGSSFVIEVCYMVMNYHPRFFSSPLWHFILEVIEFFFPF